MVCLTLQLLGSDRCTREMARILRARRCYLVYEGPPVVVCCADQAAAAELVEALARSARVLLSSFHLRGGVLRAAG